jgi:hypothetical protein
MTAMGNYEFEAGRCEGAGAHLAACIMLAATIEGQLVICVNSFREEAQRALERLQKSGQIKERRKLSSVLRWQLGDLLMVAQEAQWLPEKMTPFPFPVPDPSKVLSASFIQDLRNLVHPGRLVRERKGQAITKEDLDLLHETCLAISLHLAQKLAPQMFDPEMPSFRIQF